MFESMLKSIREAFSGEVALAHVASISRYHRMQASPGFREAAHYCQTALQEAGLDAEILSFPANTDTFFWSARSFQEWEAQEATLYLVSPEEERRKLCDYRTCKLSLIQRSTAFDGEVEVVLLENGEEEEDYEGLDVRGKVVLTRGDIDRVRELAVEKRGAVGIIFDGMREASPVRQRMDLPDARQYTSFWWRGDEKTCFGFVLSPRQGEWLRSLIRKQAKEGKPPVRVQAHVDARLYDGSLEVVSALIPGRTDEEVVVIAHLCHPQPSANDNASGAGTALEVAATLQRLIATGKLSPPRRGIRFLLVPEMTGTYAYLAAHEETIPRLIAGVNLDMVGQDQCQCGSSFLIDLPPDATPSFAPDLMIRLREALLDDGRSFSGMGSYALFRHAVTPFSGGSDHYVLSDPTVGVPTPMLIQWPDKFYHTSQDTVDKVDPAMLARIGTLAATYAYFIANAGAEEATWLGYEMLARFQARLARVGQKWIDEILQAPDGETIARLAKTAGKRIEYLVGREREALGTLKRLSGGIGSLVKDWQRVAAGLGRQQDERVWWVVSQRLKVLGLRDLPSLPSPEPDENERKAARMVPRRLYRGPLYTRPYLNRLSEAEREEWRQVLKDRRKAWTLAVRAQYWADGQRTLLEIADLIENEIEERDVAFLVRYFELLEKMGLVEVRTREE